MSGTTRRACAVSVTVTTACLALVLSACGGGAMADSAGPTTGGIILAAGAAGRQRDVAWTRCVPTPPTLNQCIDTRA
jgi:hypothetical protein